MLTLDAVATAYFSRVWAGVEPEHWRETCAWAEPHHPGAANSCPYKRVVLRSRRWLRRCLALEEIETLACFFFTGPRGLAV
jgi:hypothetical protein